MDKIPQNATNNGGNKIPSHHKTSSRDSPKKSERSTPKKDKNRSSSSSSSSSASMMDINAAVRQHNQPPPGYGKQPKQEQVSVIPTPYGAPNYGAGVVKRPSSSLEMKQEEDLMLRDSKIRKLEMNSTSPPSSHKTSAGSTFPGGTVVNGIETNPDLVSSLLKESLCSTSGFIKTSDTLIKSEYQDPMQLFDPTMTTLPEQILQSNPPAAIKEEQVISEQVIKMEDQNVVELASKLEKKKKKDKHKHKEKDKSKDKEERKKHKKDKDRHKDRERGNEASESSEPVKIKINLSNASNESSVSGVQPPLGFKIKIPKDRIIGDISAQMSGGGNGGGVGAMGGVGNYDGSTGVAAPPLKIKISKDKLDSSYSSVGNMEQQKTMIGGGGGMQGMSGYHQHHGNSGNSTSSSSSSKKKDRDRDRDREREKKRSSTHDHSKMNGNNNSSNGGGAGASNSLASTYSATSLTSSSSTTSSSKGQISNKFHAAQF